MNELLRFVGIDKEARDDASCVWLLLRAHLDRVIEDFYASVKDIDLGISIDDVMIDRLKTRQKQHWEALFGSQFDQRYFDSVSLIGIKHREIGIDPKWYIAGYADMKTRLTRVIRDSALLPTTKARLIEVLDKYVVVDMAVAVSSYDAWLVQ
jgi:hypothetical protein